MLIEFESLWDNSQKLCFERKEFFNHDLKSFAARSFILCAILRLNYGFIPNAFI